MREEQLTFLSEDVIEHQPGPKLTGRQEYEYRARVQLSERMSASVKDWKVPELPCLDGMDEVVLDFETNGLKWWDEDRIIGAGLRTPDGVTRYLPIRHKVGQNIPPEQFFRWARTELRDKRIVNIRTKFDLHMSRADGVDLEAQGCTFGDVAHYAALLDDHRRLFNQADLAEAYGVGGKVVAAHGFELDPAHFEDYPAGLVAARAEGDVETVFQLQQAMWPLLTAQSLHRVRVLEDSVIPAVVEMEHNGSPINVELLNEWCDKTAREVDDALWEIRKATGCDLATPNKRDDIIRILGALRLEVPLDAETDKPTIADDALAAFDHPVIWTLRRAMAIASLRSKFLLKYQASVARDGILRYELHQLPYQDDSEGRGGAVSGRFSSAAMSYYDIGGKLCSEGANIQQVYGVKSQNNPKRSFNPTKDYIVKKLFRPALPTSAWFEADMMQVEYRRFVHYSGSEQLLQSYADDPLTDYHVLVHGMILKHTGKDFERTHVKNLNFASLYGAGLLKIALMVGEINERVFLELSAVQRTRGGYKKVQADPRIAKTRSLHETYHGMFPEVKVLLGQAAHLAMPRCRDYEQSVGTFGGKTCNKADNWHMKKLPHRGYVETILGRRARFNDGDRFYSALNRVIQGTAADDNKTAMIDVHKERHRLGFIPRMTVHDAIGGDLLDPSTLPEMARFLNMPRLNSKVPIMWSSGCGPTWADAK